MSRIKNAIRQLKLRDFIAPLVFLILLIPSVIFRLINRIKRRKLWLVAEQGEARDNGYHFYKYVRKNHPDDYCFYAIKPGSVGYNKVAKLGNVIKYGGLKHWLYYMSAHLNISSQKSGNPAPIFWYIMHVKFRLYNNRVFLQHGITQNDVKFLYYNQTRFKYFVCGAKREYDYILKNLGYKKESLLLTGFPRWDNLKDTSGVQKNKSILIMPTWRNWLGGERNRFFETKEFLNTDFFKNWSALLCDRSFINYIENKKVIVYFFPHINMYPFIKYFKSSSKNIKIALLDEDIQEYFNKCNLMITDYSSVAFDFAYLRKPIVYFQFDEEEFRKRQYNSGYYKYNEDGFGPVVRTKKAAIDKTLEILEKDLEYEDRVDAFFQDVPHGCCNRLYERLINK